MAKYITVVGGGIIGLSTALSAILKGAKVTLIDAEDGVGQGASFANGGQLSYRYVSPLADKGVLWQGLKWMGKSDSPLNLRIEPSLFQWRWLYRFIKACNIKQNEAGGRNTLRLALYSQKILSQWRKLDLLADFGWQRSGKLIIHRNRSDFNKAVRKIDPAFQEVLTPLEISALEPSLKGIENELVGGIYAPKDETADAYRFCQVVLQYLQTHSNFTLKANCKVENITIENEKVTELETNQGTVNVDHLVIAAGNGARELLKPIGIDLPIYPLKGYSLTLPLTEITEAATPSISVTDYAHKIVYAKLGTVLRIAAMVDIGYEKVGIRPNRINSLLKIVRKTFPHLQNLEHAEKWSGLRPSTPEGPPILGRTKYKNLWLNVGHGSLGFTLAAGSAEVLTSLITDHRSEINLEGLTLVM